jgi:hypothetical protein
MPQKTNYMGLFVTLYRSRIPVLGLWYWCRWARRRSRRSSGDGHGAAMRAPDGVKQLVLCQKAEKYANLINKLLLCPCWVLGAEQGCHGGCPELALLRKLVISSLS